MRTRLALICCGLPLLVAGGCEMFKSNIFKRDGAKTAAANEEKPTASNLVAYLNRNASQVESLQVNKLGMEAKMGAGIVRSVALNGTLEAQKPRNFRLEGSLPFANQEMVDLGSNDREFWFWVGDMGRSSDTPYLYHCSHTDLPKAQLPLPIHPDWILEALGMGTIAPNANVKLEFPKNAPNTMELVEPTRSPKGDQMYKVTVFNRRTVSGTEPQVLSRKLVDEKGKVICVAEIKEMQQDSRTHLFVPHRLELVYPSDRRMDQVTLSLVLDTIAVNAQVDPALAQDWFTRPNKQGVVALDIGRQPRDASYRSPAPGGPSSSSGGRLGIFRGAPR